MYQRLYSQFIEQNKGRQHFAAHSHHYWPDVTLEAMKQYWLDSAKLVDDKWEYFFTEKINEVQKQIAKMLHLSNPETIVFASNTHELVYRLVSSFYDSGRPIKILTTDSEFHSFNRQSQRWQEAGLAEVEKVPVDESFEKSFLENAKSNKFDVIFFSHVFFDSAIPVSNVTEIVKQLWDFKACIVIDGYHGFAALPTDLSEIEERAFYIAGSYKYAGGGEGCCFMHCPKTDFYPVNTGWFAELAELGEKRKDKTPFPEGAMKFAGATMDYTALYRLEASLKMLEQEGL